MESFSPRGWGPAWVSADCQWTQPRWGAWLGGSARPLWTNKATVTTRRVTATWRMDQQTNMSVCHVKHRSHDFKLNFFCMKKFSYFGSSTIVFLEFGKIQMSKTVKFLLTPKCYDQKWPQISSWGILNGRITHMHVACAASLYTDNVLIRTHRYTDGSVFMWFNAGASQ